MDEHLSFFINVKMFSHKTREFNSLLAMVDDALTDMTVRRKDWIFYLVTKNLMTSSW